MRVSSSSSTKVFLPALLAMATLTLQAQQTTPQTTPGTGAPTSTSPNSNPGGTPPPLPSPTPTDTQGTPQSTPTATPASTPASPSPCDSGNDNGKKKDKKDKKKEQDPGCQPTAQEMAAAQDTAIRARKNTAPEPGPNGIMPGVKKGSIDDVSAVGKRDIGKRGLGNWYSTEARSKMGKESPMEIEKSAKFITDPVVTEYVNRIGQNIVKNSDCKVPFTIKVIDSDEINAMALPGGFFYVNCGLILAADEEAELAGVMAHETAHVCAHHAAREMTRLNYAQFGTVPLIFLRRLGRVWASTRRQTWRFRSPSCSSRATLSAGRLPGHSVYVPRRATTRRRSSVSLRRSQHLQKRKPGLVAKAFCDHPQTPDRILRDAGGDCAHCCRRRTITWSRPRSSMT